jgi:hypothetical protein
MVRNRTEPDGRDGYSSYSGSVSCRSGQAVDIGEDHVTDRGGGGDGRTTFVLDVAAVSFPDGYLAASLSTHARDSIILGLGQRVK